MESTLVLANIFGGWGVVELGILLMIGLLIFGKRLPEVGRSLGRSITEFKKGMNGTADQIAGETPVAPTVTTARNTLPAASATTPSADMQSPEERIAKLTAELQSLKQEMSKQRESQSA